MLNPIRTSASIAIAFSVLAVAAYGCGNQESAASNQPTPPGAAKPVTNAELTKQRQALIQKHKDQ